MSSGDEEVGRLRERMHSHANLLTEHGIRLVRLETQLEGLLRMVPQLATREQVEAARQEVMTKLEGSEELFAERLEGVRALVAPIRRGIYWLVTLVLGAVVLALLALLFRMPGG